MPKVSRDSATGGGDTARSSTGPRRSGLLDQLHDVPRGHRRDAAAEGAAGRPLPVPALGLRDQAASHLPLRGRRGELRGRRCVLHAARPRSGQAPAGQRAGTRLASLHGVPVDAGYSGTPLPRKLGIREGDAVCVLADPGECAGADLAAPRRGHVRRRPGSRRGGHLFAGERRVFEGQVEALGRAVFPDRSLWIAWPKRTSGIATDMTEDVMRAVALPFGLVDNKVCAIDATWSGLRLVWRKELRSGARRSCRG